MPDPVLLIVIPLGFAFLIPITGLISKRATAFLPPIATSLTFFVSIRILSGINNPIVSSIGGFLRPFSINLYAGPIGVTFSILISLTGFLVSLYGIAYIKEGAVEKYHTLYLLMITGAIGAVLTADIFNLFVFCEILCISSFGLVGYTGSKAGVESAVKYLIQGSVGSAFFLISIGMIYGQFGTLNMAAIARKISASGVRPINLYLPAVLIISGIGVEAAIFPINAWLPDAHSSAPSTISAMLSGIAIKIGLYVVLRFVFTLFGALNILPVLTVVAVVTLLIGEFSAFGQSNIKRMLAYSSIGQMGLILFAISLGTPKGISAGFFQLFAHTLGKSVLFLSSGYLIAKSGTMDLESLSGYGKKMPFSSFAFAVGAFSLIGLPPFMGFSGKLMIIKAALIRGDTLSLICVLLILFGTLVEAAYFFRVVQILYFKGNEESGVSDAPFVALFPVIIMVVLILVFGIFPNLLNGVLRAISGELLERTVYIRGILG